jgi:hypothetical protein
LKNETFGFHYHYVAASASDWCAKHSKGAEESAEFQKGKPVPFPKHAFRRATVTMSEIELERYYAEWVAVDASEAQGYVRNGLAIKDDRVCRVVEALVSPRDTDSAAFHTDRHEVTRSHERSLVGSSDGFEW